MYCHMCGTKCEGLEYCNVCGAKLIIPKNTSVQPPKTETFQNESETESTFQEKNEVERPQISRKEKGKKYAIVTTLGVLFVGLVISGYILFIKPKNNESVVTTETYSANNENAYNSDEVKDNVEDHEMEVSEVEAIVENTLVDSEIDDQVVEDEDYQIEEVSEEEIEFENPYLVDYMVLANQLAWEDQSEWSKTQNYGWGSPNEIIYGFEVRDVDGDGEYELLVETLPLATQIYRTSYVLDAKQGIYGEWNNWSNASSVKSYISERDGNYYLEDGYWVAAFGNSDYYSWTNTGWNLEFNYGYYLDENQNLVFHYNDSELEKEQWENDKASMKLRELNDEISEYQRIITDAKSKKTAESILNYYRNEKNINAIYIENPEKQVYFILLRDYFTNVWNEEIRAGDTSIDFVGFTDWNEKYYTQMNQEKYPKNILIKVSPASNGSIVTAKELENDAEIGSIQNVVFEDGMFRLTCEDDNNLYFYEEIDDGLKLKKIVMYETDVVEYSDTVYDKLLENLRVEEENEKTKILNEYPDEDIEVVYSYAYFDVEGDGIKELIVKKSYKVLFSGTMHDEWQIYTLMEGTVTQLCIPKEKYSPSAIFFFGNGEIATTYYDGMEDLDCYYYSEKPDRSFSELEAYTHEFILEEGEMHLHFFYNNKDYYGELDREKYYADMNDLIIQNEKNVQFEEFN